MGDQRSPNVLGESGRAGADWRGLHLWEIQFVRDLVVIAGLAGIVYVGYLARIVTVPMLLALALAYLFEPLIGLMRRTGLFSRRAAVLSILVVATVAVSTGVTIGAGFAVIQAAKAVKEIADGASSVQASVAKPDDRELEARVPPGAWTKIRNMIVEADRRRARSSRAASGDDQGDVHLLMQRALAWLGEHGQELGRGLGQRFVGSGAQAVGAAVSTAFGIGQLLLIAVLTGAFFYFFSTSWERVVGFGGNLIPAAHRERSLELVHRMDRVISGFVRGRVTICIVLGLYMTAAYSLAGVPASLVLGPLVGILFLAPYMHLFGVPLAILLLAFDAGAAGTGSSVIAGTAAHWEFQRAWWWIVFSPMAIAFSAHVLDDWVLTPRIQGKTTDLAIPTILFASMAGGALGGVYGLLIAIPTAACLKILLQEVFWPRFKAWAEGRAADFLPIGKG